MKLGERHSPESRARISGAVRRAMASPDVRRKISERTKAAMADPAVRRKISERTKEGRVKRRLRDAELLLLRLAWGATSTEARAQFLAEIVQPNSGIKLEPPGGAT